ncbi:putative N-acetyltransferase [Tolypocladium ophioglossoides CBS 100239]|uniref:Putative N-acetyltransferase n=1 Tax=Tolypocladium ophioglossoides (strain CBS 100239) TaxID=1163406 RepID=A0A0L0NJM3_TOLOC|nr:putative N-acetyltransferase [Tolypocladium ophioglossoides CBS 100239]
MTITAPPPITVRRATPNDAPSIADLGVRVFSLSFGHSVSSEQLQAYLGKAYSIPAITADVTNPLKDTVVAATPAGALIGFAILTRGSSEPCIAHLDSTIELQRLYIDLAYHGKGVGKMLALEVEGIARERGFKKIWLGVWEESYKARKVYERLGYKVVGSREFQLGGVAQLDHVMLKAL